MANGFREVVGKYEEKTTKSKKEHERALKHLPSAIGGSAPSWKPYPVFVDRGEGSSIWDVDSNQYIDFNLCWGVLLVGHRHPDIIQGLADQLEKGTMFGLPHPETAETAEALAKRFQMDFLRFVNSGSESTLYAIRLARRYTGKNKIIKIEGCYHGVFDSLHISKRPNSGEWGPAIKPSSVPYGKGISENTIRDTLVAPFNDAETAERILDNHLGEIAALIVEPVMMNSGVVPPKKGYLERLRKLADEHNIVLIFDEVKTGVKLAAGGATEFYGIKPDLISVAKAIGGGLPIGACGGKKEIMEGIDSEGLFGTFSANPLSIRACNITLNKVLTDANYVKITDLGNTLSHAYQDIIDDNKLTAVVQSINAVGGILFTDIPVVDYRNWATVDKDVMHRYFMYMLDEGIIPMAYGPEEEWLVSVQHSKEDIERHIEAFKTVAPKLT